MVSEPEWRPYNRKFPGTESAADFNSPRHGHFQEKVKNGDYRNEYFLFEKAFSTENNKKMLLLSSNAEDMRILLCIIYHNDNLGYRY